MYTVKNLKNNNVSNSCWITIYLTAFCQFRKTLCVEWDGRLL